MTTPAVTARATAATATRLSDDGIRGDLAPRGCDSDSYASSAAAISCWAHGLRLFGAPSRKLTISLWALSASPVLAGGVRPRRLWGSSDRAFLPRLDFGEPVVVSGIVRSVS